MNLNIYGDFQICINVPLRKWKLVNMSISCKYNFTWFANHPLFNISEIMSLDIFLLCVGLYTETIFFILSTRLTQPSSSFSNYFDTIYRHLHLHSPIIFFKLISSIFIPTPQSSSISRSIIISEYYFALGMLTSILMLSRLSIHFALVKNRHEVAF